MKKALLIRGGTLGDVLLTLPVVESLIINGWEVELCTRLFILNFLREIKYGEGKYPLDSPSLLPLYSPGLELDAEVKEYLSSFDLLLSYTHPGETFSRNLERIFPGKTLFFPPPQENLSQHVSNYLLTPLKERGYKTTTEVQFSLHREKEYFLALHPGSGSRKKRWPRENFLSIIRWLTQKGGKLLLILGEAEREEINFWKETENAKVELAIELPLYHLAKKLAGAKVYLGNDSGITHLAAFCGLTTLAIFGPTAPHVWAPRGKRVKVIYKKAPCSPCSRERRRICSHFLCLKGITPEEVQKEILSLHLSSQMRLASRK